MAQIERYTGYQMDKAFQLASLNKGLKVIGDILEYREEGVNLPIARDVDETIYVDYQFMRGMQRVRAAIYFDLVDEGIGDVAQDILRNFK